MFQHKKKLRKDIPVQTIHPLSTFPQVPAFRDTSAVAAERADRTKRSMPSHIDQGSAPGTTTKPSSASRVSSCGTSNAGGDGGDGTSQGTAIINGVCVELPSKPWCVGRRKKKGMM